MNSEDADKVVTLKSLLETRSGWKALLESIRISSDPKATFEELARLIRLAYEGQTACMEHHIESLAEVMIEDIEYELKYGKGH